MAEERSDLERRLAEEYLRTHSDEAFRVLYQSHAATMFGIALRLTSGAREEAEEVFQEAWMRACAKIEQFRWESTLRTWLIGILVRCAHEHMRKRYGRSDRTLSFEPAAPFVTPMLDLERAVAALPPGFRMVLVLHDVEGYTHQEIGVMLGIEAGTSKSQLSRARRLLKTWMGTSETSPATKS
ncbi:MAG: hypothetical protein JNL98_36210 [Bryobacterales bacterium]|nr:hypothetical protein [Bryobacterales bacterium]